MSQTEPEAISVQVELFICTCTGTCQFPPWLQILRFEFGPNNFLSLVLDSVKSPLQCMLNSPSGFVLPVLLGVDYGQWKFQFPSSTVKFAF